MAAAAGDIVDCHMVVVGKVHLEILAVLDSGANILVLEGEALDHNHRLGTDQDRYTEVHPLDKERFVGILPAAVAGRDHNLADNFLAAAGSGNCPEKDWGSNIHLEMSLAGRSWSYRDEGLDSDIRSWETGGVCLGCLAGVKHSCRNNLDYHRCLP